MLRNMGLLLLGSQESLMFTIRSSTLRRVLWLDAASGLGMCLSHGLGSALIAPWMGIPAYVLQLAALIVLAAASLAAWLASLACRFSRGLAFCSRLGSGLWYS